MNTIEAILNRRSVRQYRSEPIAADHLSTILECARQAPSAGNRQPCHFIVVTDPAARRMVSEACHNQVWMADAAAIVVGVGNPTVSERWFAVDTAIAMQNMILAATELGYGTCWIGAFDEGRLRALLEVPEEMRIIAATPIGHPQDKPEARPRREMVDLVSLQRYGQKFTP
jgi:nitroreductase